MAERPDDDRQDILEELASVRKQLADATVVLNDLRWRLTQLEDRVREESPAPQPDPTPEAATAEPQEAAPAAVIPEATPEVIIEEPAPVAQVAPATQPAASSGPDWEFLLGRNWFAIIGGIAVVLGIGFFLKLAFDNNWISDTGRIILGIVVGLAFLGGGEYAQRRVPRWAQPVTASGAAILYLSIYAAFGLYRLIPADLSFILLAVVVTAAVLLALRYESIVIAILGLVGAFISPVLLGTDLPDERFVLAYILLVDIGILAISAFRNWRWLTLVGWVGSYGIFSYWLTGSYGNDPVFAHIALSGIFLTFAAAMPLYHILWRRVPGAADLTLMTINAAAYSLLTPIILWDDYEGWVGLIALSLALLYGLFALAAHLRKGVPSTVTVFSLAFASVFLALAFPLQFSGHSVALGWAAQGTATVWLGFYIRRWQTRAFGIAALLLAALHLLLFDFWVDPDTYTPVINVRFITMAFVIAAFSAAALFYHRYRQSEGMLKLEVGVMPAMLGMANLVALGLLSLEAVNILDADSQRWDSLLDMVERIGRLGNGSIVAITALWAIYGAAVAGAGLLRRYEPARWAGVGLLTVAVWKLITYDSISVYIDPLDFTPVLNIRFLTFALVVALLSALTIWFKRNESEISENENWLFPTLLIAANAVALWMLSQEVYYYFDSLAARNGADYLDAMHLTLTALWAIYGAAVAGVGLLRRYEPARWGGVGLLSVAVSKLLTYDTFTVYIDPYDFTPVLNIRFLCFALVLGLLSALAVWFRRSRSDLGENENILFLGVLIAANAVALWMISQEVIYYFDSLGVRAGGDYEDAMHLTLTVLWALYAMAVIGAGIASGHSRVRLAGIALLAVPVAKLFVFDVFLLEMAYRVVAFITLGCLLLGMGLVYQRYSHAVRGFLFGSRSDPIAQDD